jgi:hypothetical protein
MNVIIPICKSSQAKYELVLHNYPSFLIMVSSSSLVYTDGPRKSIGGGIGGGTIGGQKKKYRVLLPRICIIASYRPSFLLFTGCPGFLP